MACQNDLLFLANNIFIPQPFNFVFCIPFYFSFLFLLFYFFKTFSLLEPEFLPVTKASFLYTSKNNLTFTCRTSLFRELH